MLRRAARAATGSAQSTSPATAAWIVVAVSVCPIESCSSWASRLRSARARSRSAASASRSAGEGPSSRGASHRRAYVTAGHRAAASSRQPSAAAQLRQPLSSRTDQPFTLTPASAPAHPPGRSRPATNSRTLSCAPAQPSATCDSNQRAVRPRPAPGAPAHRGLATGSGNGTASIRRAQAMSTRRVVRASPVTPISTDQTSRVRAKPTPSGAEDHATAGSAAKGSSGRLASAPQ